MQQSSLHPTVLPLIPCPSILLHQPQNLSPNTYGVELPPYHPLALAYPANVGHDLTALPWYPTPLANMALIQKVALESSVDSPYLEQVLLQWAIHLQAHYDWNSLLKGVLAPSEFFP